MSRFSPAERRTLSLGVCLLALATAVRLLLAPGGDELSWRPGPSDRPATTVRQAADAVADSMAQVAEAERPLAPGETIDVNRAGASQLQRLPGVGPSRAAAIIRERETAGFFGSPADLERVRGIGPAMLERWDGLLTTSPPPGGAPRSHRSPGRIDLNRAHPKELEQITGIGPALAARIVEARSRHGRFSSIEDLLEIPGIGPKTLQILRDEAFVR